MYVTIASNDDPIDLLYCPQLSIYAPDPPATHYMDEQPGALQNGLGVVRVGLQPYVRAVKV